MIDLARVLREKRERKIGDEINVKSTVIRDANVSFESEKAVIMMKSEKENAEQYRDVEFPCSLTEAFGTNRVYKFCFRLLEESTDMDKQEISEFLRSETKVGQSVVSSCLEIRIEIDSTLISEYGR